MNRIGGHLVLFLLAALMASCASSSDVDSEEGACYLKAAHSDVSLKVFEVDSDGNMGALIWQGRINQGQTTRIKTTHAYFRYFYNSQPDVDQPFRSGEDKVCDYLDIVNVP